MPFEQRQRKLENQKKSVLAVFVVKNACGASIKYQGITSTQGTLFQKDGIHLSDMENEIFVFF